MSFDFTSSRPGSTGENIVPMINVVFLLLIFFLMTAELSPPDPVNVAPPENLAPDAKTGKLSLFVGKDGVARFQDQTGTQAITLLSAELAGEDMPVLLRVDAGTGAGALAGILNAMAAAGINRAELVTVSP